MARKPVGLPAGVEFAGQSVRIRFTWKFRRCETLAYPQTPKGIKAAADLRATVTSLIKHGVMDDQRYAELFPNSTYSTYSPTPLFGEYAQTWLDGREVVDGTRKNYRISLNLYWMPVLAPIPVDQITSALLRKIVSETPWKSSTVKRSAIQRLTTLFETAVKDELITRNPANSIELPVKAKKAVDPFTVAEADSIVGHLYKVLTGSMRIYAAYFEFAFYTGMRPGEIAALRWDEVDQEGRVANVCRIVADYKIEERTKTRETRRVMLNSRALNAIEVAAEVGKLRASQSRRHHKKSPYVFPPTKNFEFIQQASVTDKHFKAALTDLKIRARRQYNCRHTYATMCLMAGMNLGFIANQLGHSVQMLLSTYARWINSSEDWSELGKLEQSLNGTKLVQTETVPL
ncbi:site-specific integrase [Pseudomonas frederiksbergensis]|uniref:Site-specific integrase n=1 Tax=Pseudomonas frederiksbergensis TaxID=104087 RepID=A0A1J0EPQ7_9PSED|nr:site-specific integrase [Pseudomonas frederiksbergensis]APC18125.1 site-specific integrase [Pseudomonas frederiksbergensis]